MVRMLLMYQAIAYYGIACYFGIKSCIAGSWFHIDIKIMVVLLVANTFMILYVVVTKNK